MTTRDAAHTLLTVDERSDSVIITIQSTRGSGDGCGESVHVELEEPLGDRVLIDGHGNEPIEILPN